MGFWLDIRAAFHMKSLAGFNSVVLKLRHVRETARTVLRDWVCMRISAKSSVGSVRIAGEILEEKSSVGTPLGSPLLGILDGTSAKVSSRALLCGDDGGDTPSTASSMSATETCSISTSPSFSTRRLLLPLATVEASVSFEPDGLLGPGDEVH